MINTRHLNSIHLKEFFSHLKENLEKSLRRKFFIFKKNVLEIGCGQGSTIIDISNNFSVNAYAIDKDTPKFISKFKKINFLKKNLKDSKDIDFLYEQKLKFDFVYSFRVFLHMDIKTRINTLEYVFNSLNENGIAIVDYTGDYEERKFNPTLKDDKFIEELKILIKKKYPFIKYRIVKDVFYRKDPKLTQDIHSSLYISNEVQFNGNILIFERKTKK